MTHGELKNFCDMFVYRTQRHEPCARLSTELDVRLLHTRLAAQYFGLADETMSLRMLSATIADDQATISGHHFVSVAAKPRL